MEFNSDIFSLSINDTFVLKSEFVDGKVSLYFDFCSDNVDVVHHLKIKFMNDICGMFFQASNLDLKVVVPVVYSTVVNNLILEFEFMIKLGKFNFQFIPLVLDVGIEFKNKNSNHSFEFNSKTSFEISIFDEDIILVSFEDEYLLFSEDIEFNYELKFDIDTILFVLFVKSDSPLINIKDPIIFFIFHQ